MTREPRQNEPETPRLRCPLPKWGRRLGAAAFLFFLIKGLAWLALPVLIAMGLIGR